MALVISEMCSKDEAVTVLKDGHSMHKGTKALNCISRHCKRLRIMAGKVVKSDVGE